MNKIQTLKDSKSRKQSIIKNTPALFNIVDDSSFKGKAPFYEIDIASQVGKWCFLIEQIAKKHKIDSNLAKAIMYMETTHGWYDSINPLRKTILPMNIHYKYWRGLGVTKELLRCPFYNIEFGVIILSRIQARIKDPTSRKTATIYNFLGAEKVTEYGAQVERISLEKPWVRAGCGK